MLWAGAVFNQEADVLAGSLGELKRPPTHTSLSALFRKSCSPSHQPHAKGNEERKPLQDIKVTLPLTAEGKEKCIKIIDGM